MIATTNRNEIGIRLPPRSIEAEASILGAVMLDWAVLDEISDKVTPEKFSGPEYGAIYSGLLDLPREGPHPAVSDVVQVVRTKSSAGDDIIVNLLSHCMDYAASWSNIQPNVEKIIDAANRRNLMYALSQADADIALGRTSTDDIVGALTNAIQSLDDIVCKSEFPTLTSRELFEGEFKQNYLIQGLLVEGQPCVLAGPKKCLKSNVSTDLTLSLASGSLFLNEFYVERPVRTAFISGESGEATIKETAIRQAKTKPWKNLADYENAFWCFTLPKLGQPNSVRSLVKYVEKHQIEVLIIDPAYLAMPLGESASNLFLVGSMLGDLTKVTAATGATVILCHHARKGSGDRQFDPPELESIAWAGFQEWARQWLLLGRRAPYEPDSGGFHELWLAAGGSAGHSGLWAVDIAEGTRQDPGGRRWDVSVRKPAEVRRDEADERDQAKDERERRERQKNLQKLLTAYRRFPDGETANKIKELAGLSGTKFGPLNGHLMDAGIVTSCQVIKSNKPYEGFKLTPLGHSDNCLSDSDSPTCPDGEGRTRTSSPPFRGSCPSESPLTDDLPCLAEIDVF